MIPIPTEFVTAVAPRSATKPGTLSTILIPTPAEPKIVVWVLVIAPLLPTRFKPLPLLVLLDILASVISIADVVESTAAPPMAAIVPPPTTTSFDAETTRPAPLAVVIFIFPKLINPETEELELITSIPLATARPPVLIVAD